MLRPATETGADNNRGCSAGQKHMPGPGMITVSPTNRTGKLSTRGGDQ
jgi:hypothetical protein